MIFKSQSYIFLFVILFSFKTYSQSDEVLSINASYDELYDSIIDNLETNPNLSEFNTKIYLSKAKKDSINIKVARAYQFLSRFALLDYEKSLAYLDSSLMYYSKKGRHVYYPAMTFLNKGVILEKQSRIVEATKYHLLSAEYAIAANNKELTYYAKHNIGVLKKRLKKYAEAERLFLESIDYEKNKKVLTYVDSLSLLLSNAELVDTYRLSNKFSKADSLNNFCIKSFKKFEEAFLFDLNKLNVLADKRQSKEFFELFVKNDSLISYLKSNKDFDDRFNLISIYKSLSRVNQNLGNQKDYLKFLLKIDSLHQHTGYLDYRIKNTYGKLITHFKLAKNAKQELVFINRYLRIDSLITANLHPIDEQILENFDRPIFQAEKLEVQAQLKVEANKRNLITIIVIILSFIVVLLIIYLVIRDKIFKQRLKKLLEEKNDTSINLKSADTTVIPSKWKMPDETLLILIERLNEFEKNQGFLDRDLTVGLLAKRFKTNTKYLSSLINSERKMNFSRYINNLRLEYFINQSQIDQNFKKYTIKAVAMECGFNSAEVFSKSFYKKTGIYPSYFLKNITNSKH